LVPIAKKKKVTFDVVDFRTDINLEPNEYVKHICCGWEHFKPEKQYDGVILNGIWSWISDKDRKSISRICAKLPKGAMVAVNFDNSVFAMCPDWVRDLWIRLYPSYKDIHLTNEAFIELARRHNLDKLPVPIMVDLLNRHTETWRDYIIQPHYRAFSVMEVFEHFTKLGMTLEHPSANTEEQVIEALLTKGYPHNYYRKN